MPVITLLIVGVLVEILTASLAVVPASDIGYSLAAPYAKSCEGVARFLDPGQYTTPIEGQARPSGSAGSSAGSNLSSALPFMPTDATFPAGGLASLAITSLALVSTYRIGLATSAGQAIERARKRHNIVLVGYIVGASALIGLMAKQHGYLGMGFGVFVAITVFLVSVTLRQQVLATGRINLLSPKFLFVVSLSAYGLATPYEILFNPVYVQFPAGSLYGSNVIAMWLMVLALICVFVGSNIGIRERVVRTRNSHLEYRLDENLLLWVALVLILVGLVGMVFYARAFGGIAGFVNQPTYVGRYPQAEGYGFFLALVWQFPLALLLLSSTIKRLWSLRTFVVVGWLGFYLLFSLISGARRDILIPLIALIVLIHYTRYRIPARFLIGSGLVIFVVLTIQGWARNIDFMTNPRQALICTLDSLSPRWFSPGSSEWSYQFNVLAYLVEHVPADYPHRPTYLEAILATLPSFIVHDRPVTPSQWITRLTYPEYAERGGGFAFSAVGEAYLNFGVPGIVIGFLLVGMIVDMLEGLSLRPNLTFVICFGLILVGGLLQFPRQDLVALLKIVVTILLLPALVVTSLVFRYKATSSGISSSQALVAATGDKPPPPGK
jgi:oligosaccharide repeat unit polymerase